MRARRIPDGTRTDDYEYALPAERVARYPSERRDESRLLHLRRGGRGGARKAGGRAPGGKPAATPGGEPTATPVRHLRFRDLPSLLRPTDLLVLNDTRVFPARLLGRKPTGAPSEILLLRPVPGDADSERARRWEALVRPGGKLKPGRRVVVEPGRLEVVVEDGAAGGGRIVRLESPLPTAEALARHGRVPLPPYLEREDEPVDRERYQTVYARRAGSVAAPTAGLHFTPGLLSEVEARGVGVARVTLHVGVGTFRPVEEEDPEEHEMHRERYTVPGETARAVEECRAAGGRVWAVGTTVVRTLESAARRDGRLRTGFGETDLFIRPGFAFRVVDALVTNFHLPRSTLLMLVAAFAGYGPTMAAYREAVREGYRFYSYGDAMVIE